MKIDGACHCGRITYEAEIDPEKVGICHCTDCQRASGAGASVNAMIPSSAFRLVAGKFMAILDRLLPAHEASALTDIERPAVHPGDDDVLRALVEFGDDAALQASEEILETDGVHHLSIEQKKGRSVPPACRCR